MRKFLVMLLIFAFSFVLIGCGGSKPEPEDPGTNPEDPGTTPEDPGTTPEDPEVVVDDYKVGEVWDSIDILYSDFDNLKYSNKDTQEEIQRIRALYDELNDAEKELITNYEDFVEIENLYLEYLAKVEEETLQKAKIEADVKEAVEYLKETIPSVVSDNIELPSSYIGKNGTDVYIGWTTSDPLTISNKGVVTQPRGNVAAATLTAVCRSGSVSEQFQKPVRVAPLAFENLPATPVFAYYYTNQRALTDLERETIDVINLSFGGIDANGNVYVTGLKTETVLQERKHGIRVTFSVQQKDGFKKWTATAAGREKLAQSFVDTMTKYHFDGVDIDWEYPDGNEVVNYVAFMQTLYNKVKAANRNYLVTSAMYGGQGAPKYDAGKSHQYMDYIHLMTYDLNSAELSSHLTSLGGNSYNSLTVKGTVDHYISSGVPKEKLVVGAAFYGKVYEISTSSTNFLGVRPISEPYTITYSNMKLDYLSLIGKEDAKTKVERKWDAASNAPYLCITEHNDAGEVTGKKFITYDDPESLALKVDYVKEKGLGGIMFWELGYEQRSTGDLVTAIKNAIN